MGYFSNISIVSTSYLRDYSYAFPEEQLLWRLEDLWDRLKELTTEKRKYERRVCFSKDDLRYVLPEHFYTTADVQAAIDLAISELKDRYGINVLEETQKEDVPVIMDEVTNAQISFLDICTICSHLLEAK